MAHTATSTLHAEAANPLIYNATRKKISSILVTMHNCRDNAYEVPVIPSCMCPLALHSCYTTALLLGLQNSRICSKCPQDWMASCL